MRRQLIVLVLGILIPFLAMSVLRARERADSERDAAAQRALELAHLVSGAVDEHVAHVQTLIAATAFSITPSVSAAAHNDSVLFAIRESLRDTIVSTLWVMEPSGRNIGTSMRPIPDRASVGAADRRYFREAMRTRRPAIGEPVVGRPTGLWSITFAHPLLDDRGEVTAVVLGTVRLTSLSGILQLAALPEGTVVTLLDEQGTLLGRTDATEEIVGTNLSGHATVRRNMARGTGVDTATGPGGIPRVTAFTTTDGPAWQVYVGIPRAIAFARADAAMRRDVILAILAVIIALLVSLALARRLTGPLDALTANALAIAGGDYRRRTPVASARELTTLAESFNVMAETVAARTDELHRSEQRYRLLFETSPLPMFVFGLDSLRMLAANNAARTLYGYTGEEFLALRLTDLRPPEERLRLHQALHALNELEDEGAPMNAGIWRHRRKDGSPFDAEIFTVRLEYEGRRARLSTVVDVTARRHAERALAESEEQLRRAHEMEALGRFAGGIAHDFNNLLTGILGYCDLALDDIADGAAGRDDVSAIRDTAGRAATLTRQILAFSRKQVLQPVALDVIVVVSEMRGILERLLGDHYRLELAVDARTATVLADRVQLEQVVMNLVVNARDAMPDGGVVRMVVGELAVSATDRYPPFDLPSGAWVCLAVRDCGIGMAPAVQAQIFEPFFTTKERGKGTGLGLAMVDGIVRQSGGTLHVESAPGAGSTFRVFLPRTRSDASHARSTPLVLRAVAGGTGSAGAGSAGRGRVILLAEDEDAVRAVAGSVLRRHGFQVLAARNGDQALAMAVGHGAPLDLLLTDVVMPGMSGPELAARLRRLQPGLPVLYSSGYTDDDRVLRGVATDEMAFLAKPFTPQQLVASVRRVLAAGHPAGDARPSQPPAAAGSVVE
ncbi:MAG: ATP-binding protein [Gemmatimonadaceae bacterium]